MPIDLPNQMAIDAVVRALTDPSLRNALTTVTQLVSASRGNLSELAATRTQLQAAQQKLAESEGALSEFKLRQAESDKRLQEQTMQAVKLGTDLRVAQAQLAQNIGEIAALQKAIGDLQDRLKAAGAQPASKPVADLVSELRADTADLLGKPFRAADNPAAPGVVIDGLEFEIRGSLVIGDKIGLRTFAADQSDPAAASVMRFSIKPEMRVEVPDESKT